MNISVPLLSVIPHSTIKISGSKSETNRLLILQALFPNLTLKNISGSDDSNVVVEALSTKNQTIDIGHAGTAMRFLTAYFAAKPNSSVVLTGSTRMKERPIKILVEALRELGADIQYLENEGFPPIEINGRKLTGGKIALPANASSQYISALLLIAPTFENGLQLTLTEKIVSKPYLIMTLQLLERIGVKTSLIEDKINVFRRVDAVRREPFAIIIESDWSSASYFYSIIALSPPNTKVTLTSFQKNSIQGDSALADLYSNFGVETLFEQDAITLSKLDCTINAVNFDLNEHPDLAQTIAVTCAGLGIECHLSGLATLKIKETDRLAALQSELTKLGADVAITTDSISIRPLQMLRPNVAIATYGDHRMAMAFATLAVRVPLRIENAEVVSKSYPDFWRDLESIGFRIETA